MFCRPVRARTERQAQVSIVTSHLGWDKVCLQGLPQLGKGRPVRAPCVPRRSFRAAEKKVEERGCSDARRDRRCSLPSA